MAEGFSRPGQTGKKPEPWGGRLPVCLVLLFICFMVPGPAQAWAAARVSWVVPQGREGLLLELIAPSRIGDPVLPGIVFEALTVSDREVEFLLQGQGPQPETGALVLSWSPTTESPETLPKLGLSLRRGAGGPGDQLAAALELVRARINPRLTDNLPRDLLVPASDRSQDRLQSAEDQGPHVAPTPQPRNEPEAGGTSPNLPDRRGVLLSPWSRDALAAAAPALPPWWLLGIQLILVLGLSRLTSLGRTSPQAGNLRSRISAGLLPAALVIPLAAWWLLAPGEAAGSAKLELLSDHMVHTQRQLLLSAGFLAVGMLSSLLVAGRGLARLSRSPALRFRRNLPAIAGVVGVLAVSLIVRLGLTTPNIFTDGGSGHERLLRFDFGFGGESLLIHLLLPGSMQGHVWAAVGLTSLIAAGAPAGLVLLARSLGLGLGESLVSGLLLATWPLHAALFTSDFLQGPLLTLGLVGLASLAAGARSRDSLLLWTGSAILAWLFWCRPEAMMWAAPALAVAAPHWKKLLGMRPAYAAVSWGLISLGLVLLSFAQVPGFIPARSPWGLNTTWTNLLNTGWQAWPWWLWLGFVPGLISLKSRPELLVPAAAGVLVGLLPVWMGGAGLELLEFFRYGAPAMPWLALTAGLGLTWLISHMPDRVQPWLRGIVTAGILALPVVHHSYLEAAYAPRVSDRVFREVLRLPEPGCGLVVPGEQRRDGLDPSVRYDYIGWEEFARDGTRPSPLVTGAAEFLTRAGEDLPNTSRLFPDISPEQGSNCWYFFHSGECVTSAGGGQIVDDPGNCRALESRFQMSAVKTWTREYRFHRLVTQPGAWTAPLFQPEFNYTLYRIEKRVP